LVKEFLAKSNVTTLEHPPYSPDMAPADFYLFPLLKLARKGKCLCDTAEITMNATEELKRLSQNDIQECFQHLYSSWQKGKVT
jgi:transposase